MLPNLEQFLGGYFHQDFVLDYGDPDHAIAAFLAEATPESVQAVCSELDQLIPLVEHKDDPEKLLWQVLGCYYYPKADGLSVADWLKHVRSKLQERMKWRVRSIV